ncbi:hypothetical protein HY410_00260 [Candidatus Gottesmanbacteria bacterium]|nr:hypothetical protein [Candidatus Gottesmanbacteria bacterium]
MTDPVQSHQPESPASASTPAPGKELEGGIALGEPFPLKDIGTAEINLPKEVIAVGVSARPTNVSLPQAVQQLGVRAAGQAGGSAQTPAVALPLTDDQIVQGLKLGITSSWRWFAEWCTRRINQLRRITHHA